MSKSAQSVEVITAAEAARADLSAAAERINRAIELIKGHEDAFEEATLEHRLTIGLEIARAQEAFGMTKAQAGAIGGSMSTVDKLPEKSAVLTASPLGFSNWIAKEIPDLKRPTAIRYATAFNALGLSTADATPAKITARLKKLRHDAGKAQLPMPTLGMLYKQGKPAKREDAALTIEAPKDSKQLRLEDAREAFHLWKEQFETLLSRGQLDDLDPKGLQDLKEFLAGARDRVNKRLK